MSPSSRTFAVLILTVVLGATLISGAAVAQNTVGTGTLDEEWCLNVSSEIGTSPSLNCATDVISQHDTVNVRFQRSSPVTTNNIHFLPTIISDTRQSGTVTLKLHHTPSSKVVSTKTVQIKPGNNIQKTDLFHNRSEAGKIAEGEYKIEVILKNVEGKQISRDVIKVGSFYIVDRSTGLNTTTDPSTSNTGDISISPSGVNVQISQVISDVSRFNDQTSDQSVLQKNSIPPLVKAEGTAFSNGAGVLKNFTNMRERQNPMKTNATIRSVSINGNQVVNFGTVTYGIPQAKEHRLVITYSMQTMDATQKGIGIEIVNSKGEVIDKSKKISNLSSSSSRWLQDTVKSSVDRSNMEQLTDAHKDILNENSVTIQLTEKEERYINNNYQAYIVYRTPSSGAFGGVTVFKPFRAAIYSTDAVETDFTYRPEEPKAGEQVQLYITALPSTFRNDSTGELGTIKWYVNGDTITQDITPSQYTKLQSGGRIEGPVTTYDTGGSKKVTMNVITPDNMHFKHSENISIIEKGVVVEDQPAEFNVSYRVLNSINGKYGTVDVPPTKGIDQLDQRLRVEVTVTNTGGSEIQRKVALMDTLVSEFGYENQIRATKTMTVAPHSSAKTILSTQWAPDEYGNHSVHVVQYKNGDRVKIPRESTGNYKTPVYVEQPATLRIDKVISPDNHLVYDNFGSTVQITNVGDLSTTHPASKVQIVGTFTNTWKTSTKFEKPQSAFNEPKHPIMGGEVRSNTTGGTIQLQYNREIDYTPAIWPNFTQTDRENNDSPWTNKTTQEVGHKFDLKFKAEHLFVKDNTARFKKLNNSESKKVRIYRMKILSLTEAGTLQTGDPTSPPQYSASAYPFTKQHYTSTGEVKATNYTIDQTQWNGWNPNAIPTTTITDFQTLTKSTSNGLYYINMKVGLKNPGTAQNGTARIKVVSDQQIYYPTDWDTSHAIDNRIKYEWFNNNKYSNQVVGVAGVDLTEWEKRSGSSAIKVPIIIPNDPRNAGTHTLTVKVRHTPDYTEQYEDGITEQFTFTIDVKTWGDSLYIGYQNQNAGSQYEHEVFQNCDSTTNAVGTGTCKYSGRTNANIDFVYKDVGGAPIEQTIDAHFHQTPAGTLTSTNELINIHLNNVAYRQKADRLKTSGGDYPIDTNSGSQTSVNAPHGDYWEQGITQTIQPDNYQVWTFNHDFLSPGLYHLHPTQYRVTENSTRYSNHHKVGIDRQENFGPQSDTQQGMNQVNIMVWDDMKPVARFHVEGCTDAGGTTNAYGDDVAQCLFSEYNGLDSTPSDSYDVWEGGAIQLDGQQREGYDPTFRNNAETWDISKHVSQHVSSDNVGVSNYQWTGISANRNGSTTSSKIIHRFNEDGTYDVGLQVWDHDAYVQGAGNQNTDTITKSVTVKNDETNPNVTVSATGYSHSNTDLTNTDTERWANYVTQSWKADTSDNAIGLEKGNWVNVTGDGSIYNENFVIANNKTYYIKQDSFAQGTTTRTVEVRFDAEDFNNNKNSDNATVVITTDNTDPNYDCNESSCDDSSSSSYSHTGTKDKHTHTNTTTTCVTVWDEGPGGSGSAGGIGLKSNDDGDVKCISVTAEATADPDEPKCKNDTNTVTAYDTDDKSSTITLTDYHGNSVSVSLYVAATVDISYSESGDTDCTT